MTSTPSFAPLAARLAAKAAEIRPADGAEISWANFMALFWWSIFQMLIALCEALDARAAADARLPVASRDSAANVVPFARPALPGAKRLPRLALAPDAQDISPDLDGGGCGAAEPPPGATWRAWAFHPGPHWALAAAMPWRPHRETRALGHRFSTPISLRYRN